MAVQQNKKSRSRRDMRRSHHKLRPEAISEDEITGEQHYRHHVTSDGFYRGRRVIDDWRKARRMAKAAEEEAQGSS